MNFGKCPHCKAVISKVKLEGIGVEPGLGVTAPVYTGISYHCPACHLVLGVAIDPVALKTDTVNEVLMRLRKA